VIGPIGNQGDEALRLMLCVPTLGKGGTERQVGMLAPELARQGVDVAIFGRIPEHDAQRLGQANVRCFSIAGSGHYSPALVIKLIAAIRHHRSDVVQTFLPQMDVVGGLAAVLLRRKWVLSERGSQGTYRPGPKTFLWRRIGARADAIVANGAGGIEAWPGHHTRHVIPNGVELGAIQDASRRAPADRERFRGQPIIVSIARLVPGKGQQALLRAAARVKVDLPEFKLLLFGEGAARRAIEAHSATLDLGRHVRLLGYRDDAWQWLGQASMLVSMSTAEGHPNAVLEAAAAGVPQILSDIPAHRDAVGSDGALFVGHNDDAALADAIRQVVANRDAATTRAASALKRVAALTPAESARRYVALYRAVIGGCT
jgi:glycosyltransferase involved in cell wall biosynthesis